MPILSVLLGNIFFKEILNLKRKISIILVIISITFLLFVNFKSIPWVGLVVALSWGFYNLLRKKINVDTGVGLLIESLFILNTYHLLDMWRSYYTGVFGLLFFC